MDYGRYVIIEQIFIQNGIRGRTYRNNLNAPRAIREVFWVSAGRTIRETPEYYKIFNLIITIGFFSTYCRSPGAEIASKFSLVRKLGRG